VIPKHVHLWISAIERILFPTFHFRGDLAFLQLLPPSCCSPCQVIGADHGVSWLQFCSKDCHVVCARRPPYTKPVLELLDKEKNPGNFHLTKEELKGFSSTNIRKAVNSKDYEMLAEGGWVDENVNHHLHSAVSFYMREYEVLSSSLHLCFVR